MKLAIFAKKRQVQETDANGKVTIRPFYTYLTSLIRKSDGEKVTVQVKFREACGAPDPNQCPLFIEVPRDKANLSWQKYNSEDGDVLEAAKMWVSEWEHAGAYEDHSLDDFEEYNPF